MTGTSVDFHLGDVTNPDDLDRVFSFYPHPFYAVIHFAGAKAVSESIQLPLKYYHNNVSGTVNLLKAMEKHGCFRFVLSSSAAVYTGGDPNDAKEETGGVGHLTCPYARTKWFIEEVCRDVCRIDDRWRVIALRYFNPAGAHPSGRIGEDPNGIPANLTPYIAHVAVGRQPKVKIFGGDYPTVDGTCVRDYIHVVDLAKGHVAALEHLDALSPDMSHIPQNGVSHDSQEELFNFRAYNLGTGRGYSVLEIVKAMSKACGRDLPYEILDRRPGDVASMSANPGRANKELKWKTEYGVEDMCQHLWKWQSTNPNGYMRP